MKFIITEEQLNLIEQLIIESDFKTAMDKVQKGDKVIVTQKGKDLIFTVADKFSDQITMTYEGDTMLTTTNSFKNDTLELHKVKGDGNTSRVLLKGIESVKIIRGGKVLDSVTSDVGRPEKKRKKIEKGAKQEKELLFDFLGSLRGLNVGDLLKITSAKMDDEENVVKNTESIITFRVDAVLRQNEYSVTYEGTEGKREELYKYLEKWPEIKIGPYSPRIAKGGDSLNIVLKVKANEKESTTYIRHVIDTKIEKTNTDIEITPEDVMNNPILRQVLLRKPSALQRMLGKTEYEGLAPLMKKLQKYGITMKGGLTKTLKKGNRVKFNFLSNDIGEEPFTLEKGKTYAGRAKDAETIVITSKNRKSRFIIKLDKKKEGNEYLSDVLLSKVDGGEVKDTKYKSNIKITDFNY